MMRRIVVLLVCGTLLVHLTGCAGLREAMRSKENQGMVLGGLLGAGALTLAVFAFGEDEGAGRLGLWATGGGVIGGLAGWYLGHQIELKDRAASSY